MKLNLFLGAVAIVLLLAGIAVGGITGSMALPTSMTVFAALLYGGAAMLLCVVVVRVSRVRS
jgi:hypothetical protein